MHYFSGVFVGGGVNLVKFLGLAVFCNKVLTGETPHSVQFLFGVSVMMLCLFFQE